MDLKGPMYLPVQVRCIEVWLAVVLRNMVERLPEERWSSGIWWRGCLRKGGVQEYGGEVA